MEHHSASILPHVWPSSGPWRRLSAGHARFRAGILVPQAFLPVFFPSRIQPWISLSHFLRQPPSRFDLHELPLPDTRTPFPNLLPLFPTLHQLRPERKDPALSRLSGMNRAAIRPQEAALRISWRPQPPKIGRPIHELPLELRRRHAQKRRRPNDVVLSQVNEALLLAAGDAARLALETHSRIVTRTFAAGPAYTFEV